MKKLAIVIPAFKIDFLDVCLNSIAKQTNKEFTLYIGDDASNENLWEVVEKYTDHIDIVYHRFESNLGGTDLPSQWDRCVNLTREEEWVWLFSDDDFMDSTCVEDFYKTLEGYPSFDLFRFNMIRVDSLGNPLEKIKMYTDVLTREQLLFGRLDSSLQTTVVEYVFRKQRLKEVHYFQKFDLAWGSDDATWIKISRFTEIRNIENSLVYWRASHNNISRRKEKEIIKRKMYARIQFSEWLFKEIQSGNLIVDSSLLNSKLKGWFERYLKYDIISFENKDIQFFAKSFYPLIGIKSYSICIKIGYLFFYKKFVEVKHFIKIFLFNKN